jgi:hypothetical protein
MYHSGKKGKGKGKGCSGSGSKGSSSGSSEEFTVEDAIEMYEALNAEDQIELDSIRNLAALVACLYFEVTEFCSSSITI